MAGWDGGGGWGYISRFKNEVTVGMRTIFSSARPLGEIMMGITLEAG
jgi:hypothetical protein